MFEYIPKNSTFIRLLMNIWPPFLFAGIKIIYLSKDFKKCKVKLKNWPGTRNVNGTQYGGSLFAMTDPIYSIMLMGILRKQYYIWDKAAEIEFKKPGIGAIFLDCEVTDKILQDIYENTKNGEKYFPKMINKLYDNKGNEIAEIHRTMYVRLKPEYRKIS